MSSFTAAASRSSTAARRGFIVRVSVPSSGDSGARTTLKRATCSSARASGREAEIARAASDDSSAARRAASSPPPGEAAAAEGS